MNVCCGQKESCELQNSSTSADRPTQRYNKQFRPRNIARIAAVPNFPTKSRAEKSWEQSWRSTCVMVPAGFKTCTLTTKSHSVLTKNDKCDGTYIDRHTHGLLSYFQQTKYCLPPQNHVPTNHGRSNRRQGTCDRDRCDHAASYIHNRGVRGSDVASEPFRKVSKTTNSHEDFRK